MEHYNHNYYYYLYCYCYETEEVRRKPPLKVDSGSTFKTQLKMRGSYIGLAAGLAPVP